MTPDDPEFEAYARGAFYGGFEDVGPGAPQTLRPLDRFDWEALRRTPEGSTESIAHSVLSLYVRKKLHLPDEDYERATPHRSGLRPSSRRSQPSERRACAESTGTSRDRTFAAGRRNSQASRSSRSSSSPKLAATKAVPLFIAAMDLMHTGRFAGFVLVSSDSDFARLASRLREQGLQVYGIGKTNTPEAFRKACKRFIFVENLLGNGDEPPEGGKPDESAPPAVGPETAGDTPPNKPREKSATAVASGKETTESVQAAQKQPASKAVPLIMSAMRSHDDDWVPLSVIGSHVRAAHPEFDPRTYGFRKLVDLMEKTGQFEVKRNEVPVRARMRRLQ